MRHGIMAPVNSFPPPSSSMRAYGALAATLLLWAVSFPATKMAMQSFGAGELALLRFAISSVALLAYARSRELPLPEIADMPRLAVVGLLAVTTYQVGFNFGLLRISSGPAAVLIDTIPVWAALFSALLLRERLRAAGWAGLAVGLAGAVLIAVGERGADAGAFAAGTGPGLLLMAAVAFAAAAVLQKPLLAKYGALQVTAWSFIFGTAGLMWAVPDLLPQVQAAPRRAMLAVLFLALFPGALAYLLWNQALARLPVALAASSLYLVPPLTFVAAWLWLGEVPGPLSWAGAAVALAGVALVQFKGRA
ncbi:MAG TPA: DMT family transporter [Burkholderiales bacterium]